MSEIIRLFLQGGLVMWPILIAIIITGMIMIERISYYHRKYKEIEVMYSTLKKDHDWKSFCKDISTNTNAFTICVAGVVSATNNRNILQSRFEDVTAGLANNLDRGLDWLSTIVTMAPLLGLLGTVTGMIRSFQIFGSSSGTPTAITGGVGEALVATAFGLCAAIFALCVHAYFSHRMQQTLAKVEMSFGRVLDIYDRSQLNEKI